MTILTEGVHTAEFLISEANGHRSREVVTIAMGEDLVAGTVLGKITANGQYVAHDPDASDGSETAAGVLYAAVDATAAPAEAVAIVRDAEVRRSSLTCADDSAGEIEAVAELAAIGIIAR